MLARCEPAYALCYRYRSRFREGYQAVEESSCHTVTVTGWVQEEENWKLVLGENVQPAKRAPYVAKEQGSARYREVSNFDFSADDEYMQKSSDVWTAVRVYWRDLIHSKKTIKLRRAVDQQAMFLPLFKLAQEHSEDEKSSVETENQTPAIIERYIEIM